MAINVNVYPKFFSEPKFETIIANVPGLTLGEIRSIYLQCLNDMHQSQVDYLTVNRVKLIIMENLFCFDDSNAKSIRTRQRNDKIVSLKCRLLVVSMVNFGVCNQSLKEHENVAILHFPAMRKVLEMLKINIDQRKLAGKLSGIARRTRVERTVEQTVERNANESLNYKYKDKYINTEIHTSETPFPTASANDEVTTIKKTRKPKPEIPDEKSEWLFGEFNKSIPPIKKASRLTPKRIALAKKCWQSFSESEWDNIFLKIKESTYLQSEATWFTFDWLIKDSNNPLKVLENNYADKANPIASQQMEY